MIIPAWVGLGLIAAAGAAGVAIFARLGLQRIDTVAGATLRSFVMSATLLAVLVSRGGWRELLGAGETLGRRSWLFVVAAGVCGAVSWLAHFAALKLGPAAPVSALDRLSLPLVFLLAVVFLHEPAGPRGWLGLAVTLVGTYLIVVDQAARTAV